jgi:hypothetical protein
MDKEQEELLRKHKEKYKDESSMDRTSRWVLGTIKWHYDMVYILGSGAIDGEKTYKEKFKTLPKDHQDYLINTCSNAYKPFKKYLLVYVCYLFGACYENCKRNNIKFEPSEMFLRKQFNNFFDMIEKFYKHPDKKSNIWNPTFDNLFDKKDLNINRNFFLAHYPPLEKKHIYSIIIWFKDNWKTNESIKAVFDTAREYIQLEDDENSPFRAKTVKQDFIGSLEFSIDADTTAYKNSVLSSKQILRFTYYNLANTYIDKLNNSYLNDKPKSLIWKVEDLVKKIISNGQDLTNEVKTFENLN